MQPPPAGPPAGGFGGAPAQPNNGLAIASLIVGIISLVMFWLCGLGIIGGIVAVVLGVLGRNKSKQLNGTGAGAAMGGIVTGAIALVVSAVFLVVVVVAGNASDGIDSDPSNGVCNPDRFFEDPDC